MGKMPYGRRSNEKIQGTRNEYHVIKQDEYDLNDGINKLADQMDALDVSDRFYDRKYDDMQERMNKLYEEIGAIEDEIDTISMRIENINKKQLSKDSIYRILKSFDKIYSEFTDAEKKRFINSFVESVEIFEEDQEDGRFLKSIKFRFPVYYNGDETQEVDLSDSGWDYQRSLETVVLLTRVNFRCLVRSLGKVFSDLII